MEFNICNYLDYREIIQNLAKTKKISYKVLAQSAFIHTSYFSRVMGNNADFNSSQLYLIGKDLGLEKWELDYFLLLGEFHASANSEHKAFLKSKIKEVQKKHSKVINKLKNVDSQMSEIHIREYYMEAVTAKVHMFLTIEKYRKNPNLIASKILIDETKLKMELSKLEKLGIISVSEEGEVNILKFNVHLDEASPVSATNHSNWRLESIANIQKRNPRPSDYHLSAVFSTDEEGKIKIKERFKKFVQEAQKIASNKSEQEDVFHISFDLF